MSILPPKADIDCERGNVRFLPIADIAPKKRGTAFAARHFHSVDLDQWATAQPKANILFGKPV